MTRYEDVSAATKDTATFSSLPTVTLPAVGAPRPFIPVESDPPEHQKYRNLLNAAFNSRRIEGMEARIRAAAVELIDQFASRGSADLAGELGFPLTAQVITWFLGIPADDVPRFSTWSLGLITVGSPEEELKLQMEIRDYYIALIEDRRRQPADDLASQLLAMPSLHVGWAALVAWTVWQHASGPGRWIGVVHLVLMTLAVVASANHWWLDGIVAAAILAIIVAAQQRFRTSVVPPLPALVAAEA